MSQTNEMPLMKHCRAASFFFKDDVSYSREVTLWKKLEAKAAQLSWYSRCGTCRPDQQLKKGTGHLLACLRQEPMQVVPKVKVALSMRVSTQSPALEEATLCAKS